MESIGLCERLRSVQLDCFLIRKEGASRGKSAKSKMEDVQLAVRTLSDLLARQGNLEFRAQRFGKAARAYTQALEWKPENKSVINNLGFSLMEQGRHDSAIRKWQRSLAIDPDQPKLYHNIANAFFMTGRNQAAERWYEKTARVNPSNSQIKYRLFEFAMDAREHSKARDILNEIFQDAASDQDWSLRAANSYIRHEQIEKGIEFFFRRLQDSNDPAITKNVLSLLYTKMAFKSREAGETKRAKDHFKRAIHFDPLNATAYRDLGWLYFKSKQWTECESVWKQYRKQFPSVPEPHNLLTQYYLQHNNYDQAILSISNSLRLNVNQPAENLKLAKALHWSKRFSQAERVVQKIVALYPQNVQVQSFYGEVLMQQRDFYKGKEQWNRLLQMGVDTPRAHFYAMKSMYEVGDYDAAVKKARHYLEVKKPYKPIMKLLVDDALFRENKEEAISAYERMMTHFKDHPGDWLDLAHLYQEAERLERARSCLDGAKKKFPQNVEVLLASADLYLSQGKFQKAVAEFESIKQFSPENRRTFIRYPECQ